MSFQIDQNMSLMIPRVFPQWIDEGKIIAVFHQQGIGKVYKVSICRKPDERGRSFPIYQAFIYFSAWYDNAIAYNFQQRIFGINKQARVVYDDPWFWVVFENTKQRLSRNDTRLMRLGYDAYLAAQVVEEHHRTLEEQHRILKEQQRTLEEQHRILEEQHRTLKEQQRTLKEQNCSIQQLQSLCMKSGLNIPFWDAKHPPSITETEYETASAQTAIWAAESLLEEDGDEDACEVEAAYTAKRVAEAALDDDDAAYRVAESELDDDDAAEVDAAYLSSFGIAKCGNSGDEDDGYGDYDEDDGDGDYDEEDTCYKPYRTRVVYDDY